ncbi:MAG TPA: hypothetical protein VJ755_11125 [Gemmatimonadales bacterium]|nr:hypothetical protein [Gemmatimonadales bacterium]
MSRMLLARFLVTLVIGLLIGVAVAKSLEADAAKGRSLTMKEYIEEFDSHKEELTQGEMPLGASIFVVTLMVMVILGVYEMLVFGVERLLGVLGRRPYQHGNGNYQP